jgi:spore cortex formation protein SpoVR/YcgB (stage V sporulation)
MHRWPVWFVDFEASGIALDSYPIEIAIVSAETEYHALIRPVYYWTHWSFDAQDMHGISRETLLADGLEPSLIAAELS